MTYKKIDKLENEDDGNGQGQCNEGFTADGSDRLNTMLDLIKMEKEQLGN